jgi:hypothetical protein
MENPEIIIEESIVEPTVEQVVESTLEQVVEPIEQEITEPDVLPMSVLDPETVPKVIQNSDVLYKSNIQWADNIEYVEPNAYEIEMLRGTKKAVEIIEEEQEEEIVIKSEEEIKKQRIKDLLLIFKVVSLNRLGYHPIKNTSTLQPVQLKEFLDMMNSIITNEFDQGLEIKIRDEFNKICNEKLFSSNCDISQYPVYA